MHCWTPESHVANGSDADEATAGLTTLERRPFRRPAAKGTDIDKAYATSVERVGGRLRSRR